MGDDQPDVGLRGSMRRAVGGALDATVGRVGHSVTGAAVEVTSATAEQVLEELEPYLVAEAIPRIVQGVTPYLTQTVVPEVLDGVTPRLVADLLPRILDDLRPYLEAELVPAIVDSLLPHLNDSVAPELIDALMPKISQEVAPALVDSLMPMIAEQVAPRLIDALMPKIRDEVAPELIDSLMPKIRDEVVPTILDDIIDAPAVRDLIREQSQGLFLDAFESFRGTLADADSIVDRVGRRLLRRSPRPEPETALKLVLDQQSDEDTTPLRLAVDDLAATRAMWRDLPVPPAPPGRSFTYAGPVTRLLGLGIDVAVIGWVATQGLSTIINLLESVFGTLPAWLIGVFSLVAASLIPVYLSLSYWALGRSLGMAIVGVRICTPDGRRPGFVRSVVRAWLGMILLIVWVLTGVMSLFDAKRRTPLDWLLHTEIRYSVPETQQRRHIRDALQDRRERALAAARDTRESGVDEPT